MKPVIIPFPDLRNPRAETLLPENIDIRSTLHRVMAARRIYDQRLKSTQSMKIRDLVAERQIAQIIAQIDKILAYELAG